MAVFGCLNRHNSKNTWPIQIRRNLLKLFGLRWHYVDSFLKKLKHFVIRKNSTMHGKVACRNLISCLFIFFLSDLVRSASLPGLLTELSFLEDEPAPVTRARLGHTAVLHCKAGNQPAPVIHWLRNGKRIEQVRLLIILICSKFHTPQSLFPLIYTSWNKKT